MTLFPDDYVKVECDECYTRVEFYYKPTAVDGSVPFLCKECYAKMKMKQAEELYG